jgi:hypothetical protein
MRPEFIGQKKRLKVKNEIVAAPHPSLSRILEAVHKDV